MCSAFQADVLCVLRLAGSGSQVAAVASDYLATRSQDVSVDQEVPLQNNFEQPKYTFSIILYSVVTIPSSQLPINATTVAQGIASTFGPGTAVDPAFDRCGNRGVNGCYGLQQSGAQLCPSRSTHNIHVRFQTTEATHIHHLQQRQQHHT